MFKLAAGSKIRQMLPLTSSSTGRKHASQAEPGAQFVCLLHSPHRSPSTPIALRLAAAIDKGSPISLESLVKRVATELYQEELRNGAGVLDIGLFGGRLFNSDVIRELQAGDGVFWEIKKEREIA